MIESLDSQILYWHWIVAGLALIIVELVTPVFVMLWLGAAAIITGFILWLTPISFTSQILIWGILSAILLLLWHRFISPKMIDRTLAGLSREAIIGQVGMVITYSEIEGRGKLKFPAPIVGNDEWTFIHNAAINNGDKVQVVDISGNSLLIKTLD